MSASNSPNPASPCHVYNIATFNAESRLRSSAELLIDQLTKLDVDVCAIQDTGNPPLPYVFNKAGYDIQCLPPSKQDKNAGLALIYKSSLKAAISPVPEADQPTHKRIWIFNSIYPTPHKIIIVYNKSNCKKTKEHLDKLTFKDQDILLGDLNSYPNKDMDYCSTAPKSTNNSKFIKQLLEEGWHDSFRTLYPEDKAYTRMGQSKPKKGITYLTASRIDHILVRKGNIDKLHSSCIPQHNTCDSDHRLVTLQIHSNTKAPMEHSKHSFTYRQGIKDKEKWKTFEQTLPPPPKETTHPQINNNNIVNTLLDHFNNIFPEKKLHQNGLHREIFSTQEYITLKKRKKACYKIIAHVKNVLSSKMEPNQPYLCQLIKSAIPNINIPAEYSNTTTIIAHQNENQISKEIRNLLRKHNQKEISKKVDKIIKKIDKNAHNLFQVLKNNENNQIACLFENDSIQTDQDIIKDTLHGFWKNTFTSEKTKDAQLSEFLKFLPTANTPPPKPDFSTENLKRCILNKSPTAPGESKLSWKILKHASNEYLSLLSNIYNNAYNHNLIPESWENGITTLLPKPNTPPTPDGFRPITLLSVEYKLYTIILNETLLKWAIHNQIIPQSQNGALPDKGCDTSLWSLITTINECNKKNHPLHLYYIDYSKAFDSVEHWVIEDILKHIGAGQLGNAIMKVLTNSNTRLKINNTVLPDKIPITRGTKQGDGISPLLFILFISPLLWKLEHSYKGVNCNGIKFNTAAIIDDIAIATDSTSEAKNIINDIKLYSQITGIKVNPKKSAYAHKNSTENYLPEIEGKKFQDLGASISYRYLGIWLNLDLDWHDQKTHLNNAFRLILATIRRKFYIPPTLLAKLINATATAMAGYRMQILIMDEDWIRELENQIASTLAVASKAHIYKATFWYHTTPLKPLAQVNLERYIGSIWRALLIEGPNIARNNILQLLTRPPKSIPIYNKPNWIEPQDILHLLNLKWFHKEVAWPIDPNYPNSSPQPHFPITPNPPSMSTGWTDGSLLKHNNQTFMASSLVTDDNAISWPIHSPPSSTEAEIQAITAFAHIKQKSHTLIAVTDSQASINTISKAKNMQHTNMHNLPNRTSLKLLNKIIHNRTIIITNNPVPRSFPILQLVHILSHSDKSNERKETNQTNLRHNAHSYIENNQIADAAAKSALSLPNEGHPLNHPCGDLFGFYNPASPLQHYSKTIKQYTTLQEKSRFRAAMHAKATRWLDENNDSIATTHPITTGNKQISLFCLKLLSSTLPTRPVVRRNKWFKDLPSDHKNKLTYTDDLCPKCKVKESHKHIFDECPERLELRKEFCSEALNLIRSTTGHTYATFPWWFNSGEPPWIGDQQIAAEIKIGNQDRGWRGFIPNGLYNFLITQTTTENADTLCKQIATNFAKNNHLIWKNRCKTLKKSNPTRQSAQTPIYPN